MLYGTHMFHALTKRGERAWQSLTSHIENVFEHQKAFSLQIKARVNQRKTIQKKNSVFIFLITKKWMSIEGNRKNHEITRQVARYEKEARFSYFCRKSKKTNLFASAEGCTNFSVPLKIEMSPKILAKGTNCPPVIKSSLKP